MKVWNGLDSYPDDGPQVVASIGNYDGVHLGHRAILDEVVAAARQRRVPSLLITFEPHPLSVVAPERELSRLQTRRQKLEQIERTGLTDLLIVEFDRRLASLTGEQFFAEVLGPRLRFAALFVGDNFRFGHGRSGNLALLSRIGTAQGFEVCGIPAIEVDGRTVSSSAVRRAVQLGDFDTANRMLGRPFALGGVVVAGEGRGRKLDFPTANVEVENELLPAAGVYVTETVLLASRWPSMTNVGVRPTFGKGELTVESHLFEFEGDIYGESVELRFLARIRDEQRFANAIDLGDQIARDRAAAEAYFQNVRLQAP